MRFLHINVQMMKMMRMRKINPCENLFPRGQAKVVSLWFFPCSKKLILTPFSPQKASAVWMKFSSLGGYNRNKRLCEWICWKFTENFEWYLPSSTPRQGFCQSCGHEITMMMCIWFTLYIQCQMKFWVVHPPP
nr:hypothetical protein Iba_chr03aCG12140 [Ipomoea batatas]